MGKSKRRSHPNHQSRRRRQKNREEGIGPDTINDEIEDQLERQRRKRALCEAVEKQQPQQQQPHSPPEIHGFEYDPLKKAYFPKDKVKKRQANRQHLSTQQPHRTYYDSTNLGFISRDRTDRTCLPLEEIPTFRLGYAMETCTNPRRLRDLRYHWTGRVMSNAMQVHSSSRRQFFDSTSPPSWISLLPQLKRADSAPSMDLPWDLTCKTSLHASSRTFDVQQGPDESRLPEIATIIDGGVFVRASSPRVWTERQYMGSEWDRSTYLDADRGTFAVRFAPHTPHLLRLTSERPGTMELLRVTPGQHAQTTRVDISSNCDCHDVAFHPNFSNGSVSVALAPKIGRTTRVVTLHRDILASTSFSVRTTEFSRSDALCVEYLNENSILFGHRNGSLTFLDTREAKLRKISPSNEQDGSITSIRPLSNCHTFVAKRTFGSCVLFDIRKLSDQRRDSATLWHMRLAKGVSNPTISSCCAGVAIDSSETLVIAPYADNRRDCHFAVWSLASGRLVGSKRISNEQNAASRGQNQGTGLPHTELCSTVTPSWEIEAHDDGKQIVRKGSKTLSLWFKSNCVEPHAPRFFGSIHQLMIPG